MGKKGFRLDERAVFAVFGGQRDSVSLVEALVVRKDPLGLVQRNFDFLRPQTSYESLLRLIQLAGRIAGDASVGFKTGLLTVYVKKLMEEIMS